MTRERYLSDDELERFMAAVRSRRHINQPRDHAFFALLANTGMRPAEVKALTRRDLLLGAKRPWVELRNRPASKVGPAPLVCLVLNRKVRDVVASYLHGFVGDGPLFPFTKRQAARLFHHYSAKAGLPAFYRIYALRHTVGMRLWRHTKDVRLIQAVMGHARTKAAAAYVHADPDELRAVQQSLEVC